GCWQRGRSIRKSVTLAAGTQSMRITFDSGSLNLNSITVSSTSTTTSSSSSSGGTSSPFGGVARAIPGWIQTEDFDTGGQNVGYYDSTAGNSGGAYRSTDVDIQPTSS